MSSTTVEVPSHSNGCPLFAFAFRGGLVEALRDFAQAEIEARNADFVWVHLDLREAAAQAWLRRRPWPPEIIEMVVAPIQRGRLFTTPDLVYGHLRDFRDEPGAVTLQAGSLCVVASRTLLVTGRRDSLYASNLHPLSYFVAHPAEGESDALALQLFDRTQCRVAAGGVDGH